MLFELILTLATIVTGIFFGIGFFLFKKNRDLEVQDPENVSKPYALFRWWYLQSKAFFPILLIVLLLRSFVVEPYRIPSGSMMPSLIKGDFILVNKFSYGLRLPVTKMKFWNNVLPQRGDIMVFRYPQDPKVAFIKRVVGVPGDRIMYRNKKLFVNDQEILRVFQSYFSDHGNGAHMNGSRVFEETLSEHPHLMMLTGQEELDRTSQKTFNYTVPEHSYFVLGDNRDRSLDSRFWGIVPEENLIGKAFFIWFNLDWSLKRIRFSRIGRIDDVPR